MTANPNLRYKKLLDISRSALGRNEAETVDAIFNPNPSLETRNEAVMSINVNDKAPEFTLQDENGNEVSLKSLRGKVVVLYFYPRADTPGCT
ncbi:MAG: redoxin domain-containing protein, partial [Candidatus Sulfotelmatobacter sp.]